jgi:2'-5' RNA ligase
MTPESLRLFFALSCPPQLRQQICAWRDSQNWPGKAVPETNLHLTLAFLGSQPAERLDALLALGQSIRVAPFELQLDHAGLIGERHGCLLPTQPATGLLELADRLRQGLDALGIELDSRPFRPHVTLLRQASPPPSAPAALDWPVAEFGLYASLNTATGVRYQALGCWPLGAGT